MIIDRILRLLGVKRLRRYQPRQIRARVPSEYRRIPQRRIPGWLRAKAAEYLKQDKKRRDDVYYDNVYRGITTLYIIRFFGNGKFIAFRTKKMDEDEYMKLQDHYLQGPQ